jgi:hypothetical protein
VTLTRRLLTCGVVAGPVFVTTFVIEGATRADYQPLRHPVSSLALGPGGWVQVANFAVTGALYVAFSAGLSRAAGSSARTRVGPILIGAAAVGMLGAGAFVTDPVGGYPPGTPDLMTSYTTSGALHDLFSVPTFLGLPAAGLVYAWRFYRDGDRLWAVYSAGTALAMLGFFGLASAGFSQTAPFVQLGGLYQRASVVTGFGWLTALAVRTLRDTAANSLPNRRV